jgi:hypothetical protein
MASLKSTHTQKGHPAMAIIEFEITNREPYAGGKRFGDVGEYERIDGIATYAVDPEHERNSLIVDLEFAARDVQGRVVFHGDVCLLVPRDPKLASRRLLIEVPNRGSKSLFTRTIHRVPPPKDRDIPHGDGFLLKHGYTVGWVGWQWDVYRSDSMLGLDAPGAVDVTGTTRVRFQVGTTGNTRVLAHRGHRPLPAADVNQADAVMYERDWTYDEPPREIPRDRWRFAREENGELVPDPERVYYESGFELGKVYEIIYTTNHAPVAGAGLLAVRDMASFLKYSDADDNPCAGTLDRVYATGRSQTGRFLRHFVYLGLNLDEEDRQVYDGMIALVAGARRGEFNHRYAQPSVRDWPSFGHQFPFADEPMPDPDTGVVDGLLKRQREIGGVPKIFWMNSSAEYWRGDCALLHVDPTGARDLDPAPETRIYSFVGCQHALGDAPLRRTELQGEDLPRNWLNSVDYAPLMRNLYLRLDQWVAEGVEPPASYHPRLDDGTAITYDEYFAKFPAIPGLYRPDPERLRYLRRIGMGPLADKGIGTYPPPIGERYPALVWDIDEDGNEVGAVKLPDIAHPIATLAAWNPRHPDIGAPEQILLFSGSTFYFPRTAEERSASADPRASIAERYASKEEYLALARAHGERLVEAGYVLAEDLHLLVEDAEVRWDDAHTNDYPML